MASTEQNRRRADPVPAHPLSARPVRAAVAGVRPGPARTDRPIAGWVLACAGVAPLVLTSAWLIADAVQPASYSPMVETVSVLAGPVGNDRWILTTALVVVGACYIATAVGLVQVRRSARIGLIIAGAAAIGIALNPEPAAGPTPPHMVFTGIGAAMIAIWPALTARRGADVPMIVGVPVAVTVTAAFLALLGWMLAEADSSGVVGLAERLDSSIQTTWPFVVAIGLRRSVAPR